MSAIEKIEHRLDRDALNWDKAVPDVRISRGEFRAALAEAWEMGNDAGYGYGYEVGNGYEFPESTDNPFEEKS